MADKDEDNFSELYLTGLRNQTVTVDVKWGQGDFLKTVRDFLRRYPPDTVVAAFEVNPVDEARLYENCLEVANPQVLQALRVQGIPVRPNPKVPEGTWRAVNKDGKTLAEYSPAGRKENESK